MNYRANFTKLIEELLAATQVSPLWNTYMSAATRAGIVHGVAFSAACAGEAVVQPVTADSAPPGWSPPTFGEAPRLSDPLVSHAIRFRRPFRAADALTAGDMPHQPQNGTNYAANETFILPDFTLPRTVFIYLYGNAKAIGELAMLHLAGLALNARLREVSQEKEGGPSASLSAREWQCLQWAAAGKTDWEIGEILDLSEKTVNEYVERAKHKLGVPTRIQAIVEGIRWGAIRI